MIIINFIILTNEQVCSPLERYHSTTWLQKHIIIQYYFELRFIGLIFH